MGQLVFQATLGGAVNLIGPNTASTINFTLPSADGTSGQALATNGTGTLAFSSFATLVSNTFSGSQTLSAGTANGVTYLNGSKVLTSGSALTFDGTNLALTQSGNPTMTVKATGAGNNPLYRLQADTNYWEMLSVFSDANDTLRFRYNGSDKLTLNRDGTVALAGGDSDATGTGITFPATQNASSNANTLDDYEEGTWTPTVSGGTTAGTGTYSAQNGRYTKIGNQVTVTAYLNWTAHTGTGGLNLTGLPFTVLNVNNVFYSASFGLFRNVALTALNVATGYAVFNQTLINVEQYPTGGGNSTSVPIDTSAEIMYTLTYFTT